MEQAVFLPDDQATEIFRFLRPTDLPRMVELAGQFFRESEMGGFATFSPESIERTFEGYLELPDMVCIVFCPDGEAIEGFIMFVMEKSYTVEPLALGWLFYVSPEYRKSPAGRMLLELATDYADAAGCVAFYGGVMAGIDGVAKTMPNLYRKQGFKPLWWGRKILGDN